MIGNLLRKLFSM